MFVLYRNHEGDGFTVKSVFILSIRSVSLLVEVKEKSALIILKAAWMS